MNRRMILIAAVVIAAAFVIYRAVMPPPEQASGAPLVNVAMPDLSPAAREGKVLFDRSCAACHGDNAAGRDGLGPPLIHKIYEPGHHADVSFHLAATNGVRSHHWTFGDMPPVEGIADDEIDRIVVYIREVQRANGIN